MHFEKKVISHLKSIIEIGQELEKNPAKNFNPWAFIQRWANKNGHPAAILDTLIAIRQYRLKINNPWAYGNKIMSVQSGNYYEAEHIKQSEEFKKDWDASDQIKGLLDNIGSRI